MWEDWKASFRLKQRIKKRRRKALAAQSRAGSSLSGRRDTKIGMDMKKNGNALEEREEWMM